MVEPMPRFSTVSAEAGSAALAKVKLAAAASATDNDPPGEQKHQAGCAHRHVIFQALRLILAP